MKRARSDSRANHGAALAFGVAFLFVAAPTALTGCGSSEAQVSVTEVTAARAETRRVAAERNRAIAERDAAHRALAGERVGVAQQVQQRMALDLAQWKERDELATKAWNALDLADEELAPLKARAAALTGEERERAEAAIAEASKKAGHIKANLKALTCDESLAWGTFKPQTEEAIRGLELAVRRARVELGAVADASAQPEAPEVGKARGTEKGTAKGKAKAAPGR